MNKQLGFAFLVVVTLTLQGCLSQSQTVEMTGTQESGMVVTWTVVTPAEESTPVQTTGTVNETTGTTSAAPQVKAALNGSFHITKEYKTPGGMEPMDVTVVIKEDVITAVSGKNVAIAMKSKDYQDKFLSGIAGQIVGKKVSDVNVTNVNGSSLTAQAFNTALHNL